MTKRILFIENALSCRGTSVTLYNMAHFNEVILKNKSIILTRPLWLTSQLKAEFNQEAYDLFTKRFEMLYYLDTREIDDIVRANNIDLVFIEKAGSPSDQLNPVAAPSIIHAVFTTLEPHGTLYCPISESLNLHHHTNYPVLPYMVHIDTHLENMRDELGIPENALVYGTYSGRECFNISYIQKVVQDIANRPNNDIYFLFMNIDPFCTPTEFIRFLPGTTSLYQKRKFINTCTAQLYGRDGGETFGLAVGEFALAGKPILCRPKETGDSHLRILGDVIYPHSNYEELYDLLVNFRNYPIKDMTNNGYWEYTPEKIMELFNNYIQKLTQ